MELKNNQVYKSPDGTSYIYLDGELWRMSRWDKGNHLVCYGVCQNTEASLVEGEDEELMAQVVKERLLGRRVDIPF